MIKSIQLNSIEAQPSSTSTTVHQSWSSIAHPSQTKTVYESTERFVNRSVRLINLIEFVLDK